MQLLLTEEEKQYIEFTNDGNYAMKCRDDAPESIKNSINRKIAQHKKWLKELESSGGKHG